MASNNKVNSIVVTDGDISNLPADVETDVAAMQALGYSLISASAMHVNDVATGGVKIFVVLSYTKAFNDPVAISAPLAESGYLRVHLPRTAFGDIRVAIKKPLIQIDASYGLLGAEVETFTDALPGTGSVDTNESNFRCQTGVGLGGYGVIRSKQALRYRPGEGSVFRFTALFDPNPVANSLQAAGAFSSTNGFLIGYDGINFGVMHRSGGQHEIRTLTITTPAAGTESLTVTLNGAPYTFNITAGTTAHNAYEIAAWFMNPANQSAWEAYQEGDTVTFFNLTVGPASGSYSANTAGAFVGSIVQTTAGVANEENWTYQAAFTVDPLDGSGPSGMILDASKGNVYEVSMQYLGYGDVFFSIENPANGEFFVFHRWEFANARTKPTLSNPTLKVGWIAASLGSTQNLIVRGASAKAAIEGELADIHPPLGDNNIVSGVTTTVVALISIRVKSVINGYVQLSDVIPRLASVSPAGTRACQIKVYYNPTFSGETNWEQRTPSSIVDVDKSGVAVNTASSREIISTTVEGGGTKDLYFDDIVLSKGDFRLSRGDILTVAASIDSGPGSDVNAAITWVED